MQIFGNSARDTLRLLLSQPRKLAAKRLSDSLQAAASSKPVLAIWWNDLPNWGDIVNPVLVEHLSGRTVLQASRVFNVRRRTIYTVIGSILDGLAQSPVEVWGSGFKVESSRFRVRPRRIHAMRGPLSAAIARSQGLSVPDVFGDPALLFPLLYTPEKKVEYQLGIIPHYADRNSPYVARLGALPGVHVIDILSGITAVPDEIARCAAIASSSLHGMILADSYGIPSTWLEFSSNVEGSGFKFRDYLAGVGRREATPLLVTEATSLAEIVDRLGNDPARPQLNELLRSCPFLDPSQQWLSMHPAIPQHLGQSGI
ncbi:MAG TPA: polysaccharide pyruvyl transferase family protein [Gemmatimonadales bacterium]|nr:polysaccharide pyruvyl transferase family protein [Gemmatimonadales bacterium]